MNAVSQSVRQRPPASHIDNKWHRISIYLYYVQLYTHSVEGERNAWREKNRRKSDETKRLTYVISYLISSYFCLSFGFIITRMFVHHHVLSKQRQREGAVRQPKAKECECVCVVELLLCYWCSAHTLGARTKGEEFFYISPKPKRKLLDAFGPQC